MLRFCLARQVISFRMGASCFLQAALVEKTRSVKARCQTCLLAFQISQRDSGGLQPAFLYFLWNSSKAAGSVHRRPSWYLTYLTAWRVESSAPNASKHSKINDSKTNVGKQNPVSFTCDNRLGYVCLPSNQVLTLQVTTNQIFPTGK